MTVLMMLQLDLQMKISMGNQCRYGLCSMGAAEDLLLIYQLLKADISKGKQEKEDKFGFALAVTTLTEMVMLI